MLPEIFAYDTRRYRFREWAESVLQIEDLEHLHEESCGGAQIPTHRVHRFIKTMKEAFTGDIRTRFAEFVTEYLAPRVTFVPWTEIYPNFRVHEKGQPPTSHMHRDRDYLNNDKGSMKIWLPFTRVAGGGTLWVESEDGKDDARPYDMIYGQALFFDSLNLLHGCRFNDSANTRVSMDFIVRRDPRLPPHRRFDARGAS